MSTVNVGSNMSRRKVSSPSVEDPDVKDVEELKEIKLTLPKGYDLKSATPVIQSAGRYAPFDTPEEIGQTPADYPSDGDGPSLNDHTTSNINNNRPLDTGVNKKPTPPPQKNPSSSDEQTPPASETGRVEKKYETQPVKVKNNGSIDYSMRLSKNFTLADFSVRAVFRHEIVAQHGLSVDEIIANLQYLAINFAEPVREMFGPFQLNSGFRPGSSRSDHERGQAFDVQWPGISVNEYFRRMHIVANKLDVKQVICEYGRNACWGHIAGSRTGQKSSVREMTMKGGHFYAGLNPR